MTSPVASSRENHSAGRRACFAPDSSRERSCEFSPKSFLRDRHGRGATTSYMILLMTFRSVFFDSYKRGMATLGRLLRLVRALSVAMVRARATWGGSAGEHLHMRNLCHPSMPCRPAGATLQRPLPSCPPHPLHAPEAPPSSSSAMPPPKACELRANGTSPGPAPRPATAASRARPAGARGCTRAGLCGGSATPCAWCCLRSLGRTCPL